MAWQELLLNFAVIALGALAGSAFMWLVLGPIVLKRAAPKLVRNVMTDIAGLTPKDIEEAKGDVFKAMTHKQGATFADAVNGALGNLMGAKPDAELEQLAKQYGFSGVEDAKQRILGGTGVPQLAGSVPPQAAGALLDLVKSNGGGRNRFAGLVETITVLQALAGGAGGLSGMSGMAQGGGTFAPGIG